MILALVNDLLFRSKIKTTAAQVGTTVSFPKSAAELLGEARAARPALVVVDLNQADALAAVASLKGDPELQQIRVVGFVSHVMAELIEEARAAGTDDVMARSRFTATLPELLRSAS